MTDCGGLVSRLCVACSFGSFVRSLGFLAQRTFLGSVVWSTTARSPFVHNCFDRYAHSSARNPGTLPRHNKITYTLHASTYILQLLFS